MKNKGRTLLTLTERLDLASGSRAASPEAAAKLVQRFSNIRAQWLFFGSADVDILSGLTGKFWEHPAVDMSTYRGFCHSFRLAINYDNDFFPPPTFRRETTTRMNRSGASRQTTPWSCWD